MSENNRSALQKSREKSIPDLVDKYQKLVNETYTAVTKPLPDFTDIINEKQEIIATAEMQLFSFIDIRNKALDNADMMLKKINRLEIELYNPELLSELKTSESGEDVKEEGPRKNWTKKVAEQK